MKTTHNKKTAAIIFGGISPEHEVSIITGVQILNSTDQSLYNVIPVYISKEGKWYTHNSFFSMETFKNLETIPYFSHQVIAQTDTPGYFLIKEGFIFKKTKTIKIDIAFPCVHGDLGEGGGLQGLLEVLDIPYVGSNILGSALGMNKIKTRELLENLDMETIPYSVINKINWQYNLKNKFANLNFPLVVKPVSCGSSIGVSVVKNFPELESALHLAFTFDNKVIVEKYLKNYREINIAVIDSLEEEPITSVCEEVFYTDDLFTFEDKYKGKSGKSG